VNVFGIVVNEFHFILTRFEIPRFGSLGRNRGGHLGKERIGKDYLGRLVIDI
jgi:hypothetical protein